jgi:hypothetical protein
MAKSDYEKGEEFAKRMANDEFLVALRSAEDNLRKEVERLFSTLKNENDYFLFTEDEVFDANDDDNVTGLCLEQGELQVMTELEDGEVWNVDIRDLTIENLKDIYHILKSRLS